MTGSMVRGFLDGFAGGSLFTADERPGAPNELFAQDGAEDYAQRALVETLTQLQQTQDEKRVAQETEVERLLQDIEEHLISVRSEHKEATRGSATENTIGELRSYF